jgi:hypothetical protein
MPNHWLSDLNYQKSLAKNISEAAKNPRKNGSHMDMTKVKMSAAEREFANALLSIAQKYGKLSNNDGNGIWVGYVSRKDNDNYDIGVRCENCVLHESEYVCKVVKNRIEPGGYCRLAAIPDGLVSSPEKSDDDEEEDTGEED